jgi:hypothetical protein
LTYPWATLPEISKLPDPPDEPEVESALVSVESSFLAQPKRKRPATNSKHIFFMHNTVFKVN